jgi:type II secretory pathway pseudopilin PulG
MKKIKNSNNGYTLIELLAVMIILIAVGTIIASIFVSALRGGNKSTTTNDIRQSGNFAISQMSKMIAYAKSFNGVSADGNTFDKCTAFPVGRTFTAVKITSFDLGATTFSCMQVGSYWTIASNGAALLDTNTIIATAGNCNFTCNQANDFSPLTININLTLQKKPQNSSALLPESQTIIPFNTSVTLRNIPQ